MKYEKYIKLRAKNINRIRIKEYKKRRKYQKIKDRYFKKIHLEVYFGVPGSGKTTLATWLAKKAIRLGIKVYSNVPINGTLKLNPKEDLGKYLIEECLVVIDEAGLEHSNREFKTFSKDNRYFYKMHRHYRAKVVVFSQADDMDIVIRNLAFKFWLVKKSLIPYFTVAKGIHKYIGIDSMTHDIKSMYDFDFFLFNKWVFNPPLWKMFNTYDAKILPEKSFEKW